MAAKILLRRGSEAEWLASNPILQAGEFVIDKTANSLKVGNGADDWSSLPYIIQPGDNGTNGVSDYPVGSLAYFPGDAPAGWLRCDGSEINASSYPSVADSLPLPMAFSGGVGAQYGTAANNGVVVSVSSTLSAQSPSSTAGYDNLTDGAGDYSGDYPVWHSDYTSPVSNIWVAYSFPTKVVIDTYYMTARSGSWIPTEWNFQASDDFINWTTIEHAYGYPTRSAASSGLSTYNMSSYGSPGLNTTAYTHYRIQFLNNNYGYGYIAVSELAMTGQPTAADPTKRRLPNIPSKTYGGITFYACLKV